jgi:hypothetical protein
VGDVDRRKDDVEIDAIEQRPAEASAVEPDAIRRARAAARPLPRVPAGAGVDRGDDERARRKRGADAGAADGDLTILERLAQRLEDVAPELEELVEEQASMVSEGDLAGPHRIAAADEARGADRVMGSAEGTGADDAAGLGEEPSDGVDGGHLQRLFERERRKDGGQPASEHGLARAGRADHQEVVGAGGGDLEGAAGPVLPADVGEILMEGSEIG